MSDDDLQEPPDDSDATVTLKRSQIRSIEQKAKTAEALEAELNSARRKLAMLDAGIDLSSAHGKLFAKAYDGDPDPEKIRAAAIESEILPASGHSGETAAAARVAEAAAGAGGDREIDLLDALREAKSQDELMRIYRAAGMPVAGDD
jgi:hypothetical protein